MTGKTAMWIWIALMLVQAGIYGHDPISMLMELTFGVVCIVLGRKHALASSINMRAVQSSLPG